MTLASFGQPRDPTIVEVIQVADIKPGELPSDLIGVCAWPKCLGRLVTWIKSKWVLRPMATTTYKRMDHECGFVPAIQALDMRIAVVQRVTAAVVPVRAAVGQVDGDGGVGDDVEGRIAPTSPGAVEQDTPAEPKSGTPELRRPSFRQLGDLGGWGEVADEFEKLI